MDSIALQYLIYRRTMELRVGG